MTTYNTGNVLGSSDPRDLYDNAENLDNLVNGEQPAYNDRLGKSRRSWQSVEDQVAQQEAEFNADQSQRAVEFDAAQENREGVFNAYLVSAGYQFAGDYAAGIEVTQYNQVVRDTSGELWRAAGSTTLPYTTTGAGLPEGGAFVAVGDAVLRQELGLPVSGGNGALRVSGSVIYVDTIADLQALPTSELVDGQQVQVSGYYAPNDGGGGPRRVWRTGSAGTYAGNGGSIIVPTGGDGSGAWVWEYSGAVSIRWFGAKGEGSSGDTMGIRAALDEFSEVFAPAGIYLVSGTLRVRPGCSFEGVKHKTIFILADNSDCDLISNVEHDIDMAFDKGIVIKNLTLDGNALNQNQSDSVLPGKSYLAGLRLVNCEDAVVEGVVGKNCTGYGVEIKASKSVRVKDCIAFDNGDDGFSCSDHKLNANITDGVIFEDCIAYHNGKAWHMISSGRTGSGFEVDDGPDNVMFSRCVAFENASAGFDQHIHGAPHTLGAVTWMDCIAFDNGTVKPSRENGYRIAGTPVAGDTIGPFRFVRCQSWGHARQEFACYETALGGDISEITISDCNFDGMLVDEVAVLQVSRPIKKLIIRNTKIRGSGDSKRAGIAGISGGSAANKSHFDVIGCDISNVSAGISTDGATASYVSGNLIYGLTSNNDYGIRVGAGARVVGNDIRSEATKDSGISSTGSGTTITDNLIDAQAGWGIRLNASDNIVVANRVKTAATGVSIGASSDYNIIQGNNLRATTTAVGGANPNGIVADNLLP